MPADGPPGFAVTISSPRALAAAEEALGIWRELAAEPGHRAGLAWTLLNLGIDLRDLAGSGELVSGSLRAATIYRREGGEWPLLIAARRNGSPGVPGLTTGPGGYRHLRVSGVNCRQPVTGPVASRASCS